MNKLNEIEQLLEAHGIVYSKENTSLNFCVTTELEEQLEELTNNLGLCMLYSVEKEYEEDTLWNVIVWEE